MNETERWLKEIAISIIDSAVDVVRSDNSGELSIDKLIDEICKGSYYFSVALDLTHNEMIYISDIHKEMIKLMFDI